MPRRISRREFVNATLAGAAFAAIAPRVSLAQPRRPNILFILADDLGYGDLSCYGRPDYKTPNLDRLATQGVRFANAYSASPLCTPTRCAFITGRYPARTQVGLEEPLHEKRALGDKALTLGLPTEHPTIASLLKQSGYETALIGKWHLGYLPNFGPVQSGFEEFFGVMSGAVDFFTHKDMEGDLDLFEGKVPVERVGYITEMLTARAVEYINRRKRSQRPFYLSLHYTAPHWPWEGPTDRNPNPQLRGPVAFRAGGSLKTYASMMKSMDDGIGEVLRALAQAGHEQNTLVIFTSDNGGERFSYHWPFTGQKGSLLQGGIRVPAILRLPEQAKSKVQDPMSNADSEPGAVATGSQVMAKVQGPMSNVNAEAGVLGSRASRQQFLSVPGAVATGSQVMSKVQGPMSNVNAEAGVLGSRASRQQFLSVPGAVATGFKVALPPGGRIVDEPIITMDWTATILAAAQTKPDPNYPLDGLNLLPIIRGTLPPTPGTRYPTPADRTFFWRNSNQDAAVRGEWKYLNDGSREYLFNLSIDEREQANFRDLKPEMFAQLKREFKDWEATVLPRLQK